MGSVGDWGMTFGCLTGEGTNDSTGMSSTSGAKFGALRLKFLAIPMDWGPGNFDKKCIDF